MKEVPNETKQGFSITGVFDRIVVKEKLNKDDGSYTKKFLVSLIVRTDEDTKIFHLRTKSPDLYANLKVGSLYTFQVFPSVFNNNLYFYDAT